MIFVLKLILAPALVAGATLAGRRWGQKFSGWLVGFPIVAGPILFLLALEQGAFFAGKAAQGTILGLLSLCIFLLVYAWVSTRAAWPFSLLCGWTGFFIATFAMKGVEAHWTTALPACLLGLAVTRWALPSVGRPAENLAPPSWDLRLRMGAVAALVLTLTGLAHRLGPLVSGLLTPFPVASTVLVVFAHRQLGTSGVVDVYRGFLPGLVGFALFCVTLAICLEPLGIATSFALAMVVVALSQFMIFKLLKKEINNG